MKKDSTNLFLLNALHLPIIVTFTDLSNKLGLSKKIIYLLSKENLKYYEKTFISKRSGGVREILIPHYSLKLIQKWILTEILEKIDTSDESMAFKKGENYGIKSNAEAHKYNLYILKLDFKDFFPSIKENKIFFLFKKMGYNDLISRIFTNLCTYEGYLPQGAITSPYLSNLVCMDLDRVLSTICSNREVTFTRYADDLSFSCDNIVSLRKLEKKIKDLVEKYDFIINEKKTKYMGPNRKKSVTGITINNERLAASKLLKRKLRSMIYNSIKNNDYKLNDKIKGYISYINYIEPNFKEKTSNYINEIIKKGFLDTDEKVNNYNKNKIFNNLENASINYYYESCCDCL